MNCTATLTTATVEPCPNEYMSYAACEDPKQTWACTGTQHVTFHTLTCVSTHPHGLVHRSASALGPERGCVWTDDTPGATPHAALEVER